MTYRRFSAVFAAQADNPDFPLNNDAALKAMPRGEQDMLMERVRLVRDRKADCATLAESVSDVDAIYGIYDAAFSAAVRGDVYAGVCYARASWVFPDVPAGRSDALKRQYRRHAKKFVEQGVNAGSWPAVTTANNMERAEHGPSASVDWSPAEAYVFARLLQLGSSDQHLSDSFGYEAARHAENLGAKALASADRRAADLFRSKFARRAMSDGERYENCGN